MTAASIDLEAYFARIGYRGTTTATLDTLRALMLAHVQAVPFENLDVLLGRPISLALEAIEHKLVHDRRGGYCFEQNGLFLAVLQQLGFHARPLSARVRLGRSRDFLPPRTHLFVRTEIDGAVWLADVGVGSATPSAPIRLETSVEQSTPHEPRRLVHEHGLWFHQVKYGDVWHDVCEFTLEEMPQIDRELANWYTSTHPDSSFKSALKVSRAAESGERYSLLNREFTRRRRDGSGDVRWLSSEGELRTVLREVFGLALPTEAALHWPFLEWTR